MLTAVAVKVSMVAAASTVRTAEGDAISHAAAANAAIAGTTIGRDERVRVVMLPPESGIHHPGDAKSMLTVALRLAQQPMQYPQRRLVASQAVLLGCAQWINAASR
jgi:hypothetical protein